MINHNRIYIAPSHTKKVFANMKRQGKDFFGRVTPLKQRSRKTKRKDTEIPQSSVLVENVADDAVYKEMDDSLENATTTATSLDAEQDRGNISKTLSKATPNEPSFIGTSLGVVLELENIKIAQAHEITSLKKRVKKLERKKRLRTHGLKRLYKGRKIHDIDADEDITLENVHDVGMFGVHDLDGDEVFVETEEPAVNAITTTSTIPVSAAKYLSDVDITLAQVLAELKSAKPKAVTTAATTTTTAVTSPKAKGLVIQEQDQASTPITSSKDKGKGIMVEEPLKMKKKDQVETDYELAQRLQAEEQEELTIEEKSKLFQQLLEKRRKHFAAKRVEDRRNRPPTKSQQRSIMVNTFVDMDTELVGGSEVREEGSETREESSSKRADDGDDVTIKATPLSTKSPTIIDYKIYKEGKKSYFQIIKANGNSQMYLTFGKMLKNFDREDLEVLWSIVKARFKKTEPVKYMDIFLHLNLKTMFKHHLEDNIWKNQQGTYFYYLLVEKMYPLTEDTLHHMFIDVKLQVDYECEMVIELLKLVKK
ncbi:hypothetical protein Tco_1250930 [Tanacetum coccineum]